MRISEKKGVNAERGTTLERGSRRILKGTVVSTKMNKTIVVRVTRQKRDPLYLKVMRTSKKYLAHDDKGEAQEGDLVSIIESRPISKLKSWRLKKILEKAK